VSWIGRSGCRNVGHGPPGMFRTARRGAADRSAAIGRATGILPVHVCRMRYEGPSRFIAQRPRTSPPRPIRIRQTDRRLRPRLGDGRKSPEREYSARPGRKVRTRGRSRPPIVAPWSPTIQRSATNVPGLRGATSRATLPPPARALRLEMGRASAIPSHSLGRLRGIFSRVNPIRSH